MNGAIGIDEVGRGPLAGPVTVCACYVQNVAEAERVFFSNGIRDSKKLKNNNRNYIYKTIRIKRLLKSSIVFAVSSKSATYIDKHGLTKAINECMVSSLQKIHDKGVDIYSIPIRLDGGLKVPIENLLQESFIKGDEKFTEIALASIIAKVTRDRFMHTIAKKYPEYQWEHNVGYGTLAHRMAIKKLGINKYHRNSFLKSFKISDT